MSGAQGGGAESTGLLQTLRQFSFNSLTRDLRWLLILPNTERPQDTAYSSPAKRTYVRNTTSVCGRLVEKRSTNTSKPRAVTSTAGSNVVRPDGRESECSPGAKPIRWLKMPRQSKFHSCY